jgi:hypothetical protein
MKKLALVLAMAIIMSFTLVAPAQACACSGNDPAGWVAWFNTQDAYLRCTANVAPPTGFQWGSNCLMVPIVY